MHTPVRDAGGPGRQLLGQTAPPLRGPKPSSLSLTQRPAGWSGGSLDGLLSRDRSALTPQGPSGQTPVDRGRGDL